jgi:uncharacterized membrane protein YtjA (UPF0391 family)
LIPNLFLDWHGLCIEGDTACGRIDQPREENTMFGWAITFLIVAIVAGIFGFAGIAGTATWIAKVLFVVGLVVFLVLLVTGRRPPTV